MSSMYRATHIYFFIDIKQQLTKTVTIANKIYETMSNNQARLDKKRKL